MLSVGAVTSQILLKPSQCAGTRGTYEDGSKERFALTVAAHNAGNVSVEDGGTPRAQTIKRAAELWVPLETLSNRN